MATRSIIVPPSVSTYQDLVDKVLLDVFNAIAQEQKELKTKVETLEREHQNLSDDVSQLKRQIASLKRN